MWVFDHLESIDDIWNLFSDRLCQIITDFVPQSNSVHSFKKPWMNKIQLKLSTRKGGLGPS